MTIQQSKRHTKKNCNENWRAPMRLDEGMSSSKNNIVHNFSFFSVSSFYNFFMLSSSKVWGRLWSEQNEIKIIRGCRLVTINFHFTTFLCWFLPHARFLYLRLSSHDSSSFLIVMLDGMSKNNVTSLNVKVFLRL